MAVKRVHDRNIIHRDIKLDNVFLTSKGMIKLGDFGISKKLSDSQELALSNCGTLLYMAPEVAFGIPYSFEADVWSLGIMLNYLCNLRHPFEKMGCEFIDYYFAMFKGQYEPLDEPFACLQRLLDRMLQKVPKDRPSVSMILRYPEIRRKLEEMLESN